MAERAKDEFADVPKDDGLEVVGAKRSAVHLAKNSPVVSPTARPRGPPLYLLLTNGDYYLVFSAVEFNYVLLPAVKLSRFSRHPVTVVIGKCF